MNIKRAWKDYRKFTQLAESGKIQEAEAGLRRLLSSPPKEAALVALCHSDLGVLLAAKGDLAQARQEFLSALQADPQCASAQANLAQIEKRIQPPPAPMPPAAPAGRKLAILSLLFNWPGRGGGVTHTVWFAKALLQEGWEIKHFYVRFPEFGVGSMAAPYPLESEVLEFEASNWQRENIQQRFRAAVDVYRPEAVLIADAWNFKPRLAEAMEGYPTLWRFDNQECICPFLNCRFLGNPNGNFSQCPYNQLATPQICAACLQERGRFCGPLHQNERAISGVEDSDYLPTLYRTLGEAEASLTANPLVAEALGPYTRRAIFIPPGVDPARFPEKDDGGPAHSDHEPVRIFMAGVVEEPFKGFSYLHEACRRLWQKRKDFQLVATGQQAGEIDAFTRFTGWLSQEELPAYFQAADICVIPSIVQEGWPAVGVEAMAAGRPLIASRIGGLQFMVGEGGTGLLCEPGNVEELTACLERLLDDKELRRRLGREARRQFEERGTWEKVLARYYRPLLNNLSQAGLKSQ